jgi:hypothetical protein
MIRLEEMRMAAAFRNLIGECGWTREQAANLIAILREQSLAVLGGKLLLVLDGTRSLGPQREGDSFLF